MKKILATILAFLSFAPFATAQNLYIFQGHQGGTNIGSTLDANIGQCLKVADGQPTLIWAIGTCGGGGSGGGTWSTTTSSVAGQLINYPNNNTDIVAIGANSTTTAPFWFDPNLPSSFLKYASTTALSSSVICLATDCRTSWPTGGGSAFPFTPVAGGNATSTTLFLYNGLYANNNSSSTIKYASTTAITVADQANIGSLVVPSLTSAIVLTDGSGLFAEYAGASCTNQFIRTLSALGAATCATVQNTDLANSTISGVALGSNLASLTATDSTLTFSGAYNGSTARTVGLNLANPNSWSVLQTFTYASTTAVSGTSLCIGSDCRQSWPTGGGASYPFPLTGNATSTLTQFNGGLTSYASTTIGNGTAIGGLTVNGNATTTSTTTAALTSGTLTVGTTSNPLNAKVAIEGSPTQDTGLNIIGNINGFFQGNIMNISSGANASSDWVATANNGSPSTHYIDMGINGSGGGLAPFTTANHAYLYSIGDTLNIGALGSASDIIFHTTGGTSPVERMRLTSLGNLGLGTSTPYGSMQIASNTPSFTITDKDALLNGKHWTMTAQDGAFKIGSTSDSLTSTSTALEIRGDTTTAYIATGTSTRPNADVIYNGQGPSAGSATKGTCFAAKDVGANTWTYWWFRAGVQTVQTFSCSGAGTTTVIYN